MKGGKTMKNLKKCKIEFKHLLTGISALGMLAGFLLSLGTKKKGGAIGLFVASFAGLLAGVGMQANLIPEPECCKQLEIEIGDEEEEDLENLDDLDDPGEFDLEVEEEKDGE